MDTAWLILADGTIFRGRSFGAPGEACGEVVFNTSFTGYQEILTDPSYCGQLVTLTTPHIGNVGVNAEDVESARPQAAGLIVHDYAPIPSNWRATQPLHRWLQHHGLVAIDGIDTRALTIHLRCRGAMPGLIATGVADPATLIARAQALPTMHGQALVGHVSTRAMYPWQDRSWEAPATTRTTRSPSVIVYDFGVKQNILRSLRDGGATVTVVPATTPAAEVLAQRPDGIVFSNGPGDPSALPSHVAAVRECLGRVPCLGICLGYQLTAMALGATTFKLPFGHRGANQPVQDLRTGRVHVTSQNHGFAVDPTSLPPDAQVTEINLNDGTLEGFAVPARQVLAVQYHPEASPGPHDTAGVFREFLTMCE